MTRPPSEEAIADVYDSLRSPMTVTGLVEDTGRSRSTVYAAVKILEEQGRITKGARDEYCRYKKGGQHPARSERVAMVRALLARQGWTTVEQIAECAGVGREAARAYLCEVGAVPVVERGEAIWRVPVALKVGHG